MGTADDIRKAREDKKKAGLNSKTGQIDAIKERFNKHSDKTGKQLIKEFKKSGSLTEINPSDILDSTKFQIRTEHVSEEDYQALKQGIKKNGQLTPAYFRPAPNGKFETISGFHRTRVCKELRRPVMAIVKDVSDEEAYIIAEEENINRIQMSTIDMCNYIKKLKEELNMDFEQIANRLNKSTRIVRQYVDVYGNERLIKLIKQDKLNFFEAIKISQAKEEDQDRIISQLEGLKKKNIKQEKKKILHGKLEVIKINDSKKTFKISVSGRFRDADKTIEVLREAIERLKKLGN